MVLLGREEAFKYLFLILFGDADAIIAHHQLRTRVLLPDDHLYLSLIGCVFDSVFD